MVELPNPQTSETTGHRWVTSKKKGWSLLVLLSQESLNSFASLQRVAWEKASLAPSPMVDKIC